LNTSPVTTRFERRKQRTRDQLKTAAIELILEKGYDEVAIQDITDRADLGRGTFYVHFDDKEDILWSALREGFDALYAEMMRRFAGETPPRLEYLMYRTIFEYAADNRNLFLVMLGGRGSAIFTERIQNYLTAIVEQLIVSGQCLQHLNLPPHFIAQCEVGALVRCVISWLQLPDDSSPQHMAGQFFEFIFHLPPPEGV
jgi:AcrR family transcriptional regulator